MRKPRSISLVILFLIVLQFLGCKSSNQCPVEDFETTDQATLTNHTSSYDCPENFLFSNKSQKCEELYVQGNCGDMMIFMPEEDKHFQNFGICMCDNFEELDNNTCTFRPKLYWKPTQKCYFAYEQGPCNPGEWLTYIRSPGLYDRVVCLKNPCPPISSDISVKTEEDQFWFPFGGNCYLSGTQGFCRDAQNKAYLSREAFSPLCIHPSSCRNLTSEEEEPCIKGSRHRRYVGRCRRKHKITVQDI